MEDILFSIKRIIAEEGDATLRDTARASRRPRPTVVPDPEPEAQPIVDEDDQDDVLELTEMADSAPVPSAPVAATPAPVEPIAQQPAPTDTPMLSSSSVAATRDSLAALSSMLVCSADGGPATLEGLVREMLRPMLKDWLDARLPDLVQAMVAKEIQRITGTGEH